MGQSEALEIGVVRRVRGRLTRSVSVAALVVCGASVTAMAGQIDLTVSAPLPAGEIYVVSGSETVGKLVVGNASGESGTLTVGAGQELNSGIVAGNGSYVGDQAGSVGLVTVSGANARWTDQGNAMVFGQFGSATVDILNGGSVIGEYIQMANSAGGVANVTVSGVGSLLKSNDGAYLANGAGSTGTLALSDGGTFETVAGGFYMFSGGTVTASGDGTAIKIGTLRDNSSAADWDNTSPNGVDGWFYMSGGTATISNGADVNTDGLYVSGVGSTLASFTLTGAGTSLVAHLPIYVGGDGNDQSNAGQGILYILDGATAVGATIAAGVDPGSVGVIWVSGAGSSLSSVAKGSYAGNLSIGFNGTGGLLVSDGASVSATGKLKIAVDPDSLGRVIIGGASAPAAAGSLSAAQGLVFGAGDGQLIFNHTSTNYVFGSDFLSPSTLDSSFVRGGEIIAQSGVTRLTGDTSGFNGSVTIAAGAELSVEQGFGAGVSLSVYGTASGGTGALDLLGNGNTVNVYTGARFLSSIDYHNTSSNTLNFYTGSYTLPVLRYALGSNTINLLGTAKTLITSDLDQSGNGNIILADTSGTGSLDRASSDMQNQVSGVIGDIMSLDMARPGSISAPSAYAAEPKKTNPTDLQVASAKTDQGLSLDDYGNLFWLRGFAGGRHQEANGEVQGSNARQFGSLAGVDHLFNDWRIGLYGGGGRSTNDLADGLGSLAADMAIAGVYGRRDIGALSLDLALTGGHLWAETERSVNAGAETAKAEFGGWFVAPELALSTKYALGANWSLTPSLKGRYVATFFDGYSETGSSQNIRYDDHVAQSFEERFDVKVSYQATSAAGLVSRYWLGGGVTAQQRVGDSAYGATVAGADFTVTAVGDDAVYGATATLGFDMMVASNVALFGSVEGSTFTDKSRTGMARGGVKVAF